MEVNLSYLMSMVLYGFCDQEIVHEISPKNEGEEKGIYHVYCVPLVAFSTFAALVYLACSHHVDKDI